MLKYILLLLAVLIGNVGYGQAVWRGRTYNAPVCNKANCQMCNSIRSQLYASKVSQAAPTTRVVQTIPTKSSTTSYATETRYRTVTRQQCYTVNGRKYCRMVQVQEPYTVQVPITVAPSLSEVSKAPDLTKVTELVPTPKDAVLAMFSILEPTSSDILFEPGCGDGRVLLAASSKYNCKVVGIELNPETADIARKALKDKGLVLNGDARAYSYQDATIVSMYLYPDLMVEIVPLLKKGTKIISYCHEIPGVESIKHEVGEHVFYTGVK